MTYTTWTGTTPREFVTDPAMRKALRLPFPDEEVGQVDKGYGPIDFVGHAAVTDRLNAAAPGWTYDIRDIVTVHGAMVETGEKDKKGNPKRIFQLDPGGMPHVVAVYGWMEVGGVRRWEAGQVENVSTYGDELKKAISDFISRAAMRFGVALDLWSKQELAGSTDARPDPGAGSRPSETHPQTATNERGPADTSPSPPPGSDPETGTAPPRSEEADSGADGEGGATPPPVGAGPTLPIDGRPADWKHTAQRLTKLLKTNVSQDDAKLKVIQILRARDVRVGDHWIKNPSDVDYDLAEYAVDELEKKAKK